MSQSAAEARAISTSSGRQPSPQTEAAAGDHTRRGRSPDYAANLHKGNFPPATGPLCAKASENSHGRVDKTVPAQAQSARFDVATTPDELVAATRQAIANATAFDARDINRNFDYDSGNTDTRRNAMSGRPAKDRPTPLRASVRSTEATSDQSMSVSSDRCASLTGSGRNKFGEGAVWCRTSRTAIGSCATRLSGRSWRTRPSASRTRTPCARLLSRRRVRGLLRSLQMNPFPSILILHSARKRCDV
jgi:hypothetical protein